MHVLGDLMTQGHRLGVLQVGEARSDRVDMLLRLSEQRLLQLDEL